MNNIPDNVLESFGKLLTEALANGDQVAIPSFGTFSSEKVNEKVVYDSNSDEQMLIPPRINVQFTPALKLVKMIKEGKK